MTRPFRRLSAILLIAASAAMATACSAPADTAPATSDSAVPTATSPAPSVVPEQSSVPAAQPTCDRIIPESTSANFESIGWTAKSAPFRIGSLEITAGIQCTWGDYTIASDRVQIFGWAPIDSTEAASAQQELLQSGWKREDSTAGTYLTEDASTAIAPDDEGYGLTYLFGDGWVKYADTKQGLLLVEWPKT